MNSDDVLEFTVEDCDCFCCRLGLALTSDCGPVPVRPGRMGRLEAWRWRQVRRAGNWRRGRVRILQWGGPPTYATYIRFTPSLGLGVHWFKGKSPPRARRLRVARHHGIQMVEWYGARWVVTKQLFGASRVVKESFDLKRKN